MAEDWPTTADLVADAVRRKQVEIARHEGLLRGQHLQHDGHRYYADEDSLATITTTLAVVQMMDDADPVPTPQLVAGKWMSADRDQTGCRVLVPMSAGQFISSWPGRSMTATRPCGARGRYTTPRLRPWPRAGARWSRYLDMITRPAGRQPEREDTMNGAMWAKIAKAVIAVGAVAGIQIEPDQLELIAQGAGSVLAIIYAIEARLKSGRG